MRSKKLKPNSSNSLNPELGIDCNDWEHNNNHSNQVNTNTNIERREEEEEEQSTADPSVGLQLNYTPKLFLRCHCKQNDPFDNSTPIWSAAFQPKTSEESDGNRFVATCGANMVCIIDCNKSIESSDKLVIARYIDSNVSEEFVSLAWSLITMDSNSGPDSQVLILAVGGKKNILLLSDLNGFHCYERLNNAHSDQINALLFTQNDLLLSASYDKSIKLWRISRPNEDKTTTQLLRTIDTKIFLLSLCYSQKYNTLIASGDKGVFFWSNPSNSCDSQQNEVSAQIKTKYLVDGLHLIPEDEDVIAIRVYLSKVITIIDLKKVIEDMNNKSDNKSENKSELKTILLSKVMKAKLESFPDDFPYVYLSAQKNLLASGGPNGQIWLYNTDRFEQCYRSNETGKADRIVEWPLIENILRDNKLVIDDKQTAIINTVAISPDLKFMIACTQLNLLCIWHKT